MRKKLFWVVAATAALLSACDINVESVEGKEEEIDTDSLAIGFGVYVNKGTSTKAGKTGDLTTVTLKEADAGFGVFAYYGNGALYNETSKPDFMYDQLVQYNNTYNVWDYTPIKYWPNEFGEAASSESADRLTFFAYAPYVDVTPSTGVVTATGAGATFGIIGMSRNISAGNPLVMYSANLTPGDGVDLCWGVAAEDFISSVDGVNNYVKKGYPFINVVKTKTGDRLKFEFNHALAQLNVKVDADINNDASGSDGKTKIYVRSVTFNGFSMRGSLNLNSNTDEGPIWYDISGTGRLKREPVTVYDGRTDGMEGVTTASDPSEKPSDLNPMIVQSQPYGATGETPGVTTTAVNLFNAAEDPIDPSKAPNAPVMVIPTPGVPMSVTIVYDVETEDARLGGYLSDGMTHGSSVENRITKDIIFSTGGPMILASGKKYVVNLHLGLTSVKFDAIVADWDNTLYEGGGYLPSNTSSISSVSLTDGSGNPFTEVTLWKNETVTTPTVTVLDAGGVDVTGQSSFVWASSNLSVATVNTSTGAVTLTGTAGTADITVTASCGDNTLSKSYTIKVNEVTAISVPATASVGKGNTSTLTASLTTTYTTSTYPTLTWVSADESKVTVAPVANEPLQATVSGVAPGSSNVTVSIPDEYMASGQTASAICNVTCTDPSLTAFRGYEVSPGVLHRKTDGSYELTAGTDPFEMYTIYNYDSEVKLAQYYFKWSFLKGDNELGSDASGNIDANSAKLPTGWTFPSLSVWNTIIKGTPKSTITVGGTTITKDAFAVVEYNDGTGIKRGVLLLRDGSTIDSGILEYVGVQTLNTLNTEKYNYLLGKGCLILSFTGYLSNTTWRAPNSNYGAADYWTSGDNKNIDMSQYAVGSAATVSTMSSANNYMVTRLVKKL